MSALSKMYWVAAAFLFCTANTSALPNVFSDVWGVITDPLKLGAGSENAYRSVIEAGKIVDTVDKHARDRIEQIREVYMTSEAQTFSDINALENKINSDANKLLLDVECAEKDALDNDLRDAAANVVNTISQTSLDVKVGPWTLWQLKTKSVPLTDPAEAFFSLEALTLADMEKASTLNSPAFSIFETYQKIERLATLAKCAYRRQSQTLNALTIEESEMEVRSAPWGFLIYGTR